MLGIVRRYLAQHLRRDVEDIDLTADLDADLGLPPLDVVVLVMRIADAARVDLRYADLERIHTVGDLVDLAEGKQK